MDSIPFQCFLSTFHARFLWRHCSLNESAMTVSCHAFHLCKQYLKLVLSLGKTPSTAWLRSRKICKPHRNTHTNGTKLQSSAKCIQNCNCATIKNFSYIFQYQNQKRKQYVTNKQWNIFWENHLLCVAKIF